MIYGLALAIGVIAGLRAMTAPAMVSFAAWFGWLPLEGTPLAFMASTWAFGIFTLLALFELVNDQRPSTPSRKVPAQFGGRIVAGGACRRDHRRGGGHAGAGPGRGRGRRGDRDLCRRGGARARSPRRSAAICPRP